MRLGTRHLLLVSAILFALALMMAVPVLVSAGEKAEPPDKIVRDAWEKARESGAYRFTSDIVQLSIPAATLENIGNTSHEDRFYLEGYTDLDAQEMRMTLLSDGWPNGGSVLIPESGIEIETAGGVTRARR